MTKRIYRTAAVGASLLATLAITAPTAIGQSSFTPGKETLPGSSVETEKADDTGTTDESEVSADRTIDVLVLYTGEAEEGEGSEEDILDAIDSGLEGMNKALERSDIEGQVTLAHAEKIDFQETDDQGEAMTWARESDETADLREEHSADLISVVVSGQAGIAQSPIPTEDTDDMAFSVVGADWLRSDDATGEAGVFAHELGHNLGATHDWDSSPEPNPHHPYNKGHITENGLVDIMAYNNASSCAPDCQRVPYYSNPDLTVEGEQFGADDGDRPSNLKKIFDETIPIVAAYR